MSVMRIVFSNFTWVDALIILLAAGNAVVFALARRETLGLYNTMRYVVEGDYSNAVNAGAAAVLGICGIALAITMSSVLVSAFHPPKKEKSC